MRPLLIEREQRLFETGERHGEQFAYGLDNQLPQFSAGRQVLVIMHLGLNGYHFFGCAAVEVGIGFGRRRSRVALPGPGNNWADTVIVGTEVCSIRLEIVVDVVAVSWSPVSARPSLE